MRSLGLLSEGEDVIESTDKCAGQYVSTPALYSMSQTAMLTSHAIDRACPASGHGRSDNDAAESFAATCGAALEKGFELKAVAHMNLARSAKSTLTQGRYRRLPHTIYTRQLCADRKLSIRRDPISRECSHTSVRLCRRCPPL